MKSGACSVLHLVCILTSPTGPSQCATLVGTGVTWESPPPTNLPRCYTSIGPEPTSPSRDNSRESVPPLRRKYGARPTGREEATELTLPGHAQALLSFLGSPSDRTQLRVDLRFGWWVWSLHPRRSARCRDGSEQSPPEHRRRSPCSYGGWPRTRVCVEDPPPMDNSPI